MTIVYRESDHVWHDQNRDIREEIFSLIKVFEDVCLVNASALTGDVAVARPRHSSMGTNQGAEWNSGQETN